MHLRGWQRHASMDGETVRFYLGTHQPHWLARLDIPLFVSHRTLMHRKTLPVAVSRWALDSGGFTELSQHGKWTIDAATYATAVRRYMEHIGHLDWAAPQDAMCEPWILEKARSWLGGTVKAHQTWTVDNYLRLRDTGLPFIPVLQGWHHDDYIRHIDQYAAAGIDLTAEPIVGLGSVCRRQATADIERLVHRIANLDLRLHGFGVKTAGIDRYGDRLTSADSMAWSFGGRRIYPCPQSTRRNCANCEHHALHWRQRVLDKLSQTKPYQYQMSLA